MKAEHTPRFSEHDEHHVYEMQEQQITCNCGTQAPITFTFCPTCGESLADILWWQDPKKVKEWENAREQEELQEEFAEQLRIQEFLAEQQL